MGEKKKHHGWQTVPTGVNAMGTCTCMHVFVCMCQCACVHVGVSMPCSTCVSSLPCAIDVLSIPHVPAPEIPGQAPCRSPLTCYILSLLTPAILGPHPSHSSLAASRHGHDCGVSLPAEYQILCGNQAPGFIIDIHTGKPIGEYSQPLLSPRVVPGLLSLPFYFLPTVSVSTFAYIPSAN